MKTEAERFFKKIKINEVTGCHEWTGSKFRDGYGQFRLSRGVGMISAHRWICQPIPDGMLVLHRCDNPSCVNRDHLYFGTHKENMKDMVQKKRQAKGAKIHTAKLTEDDVNKIRNDNRLHKVIANEYNVSDNLIGQIKNKEIWKHID